MAGAVAISLKRQIQTGDIVAGKALPSERDLAAKFQVSRSLIRKAVEILTHEGVVVARPRHRPVVSSAVRRPHSAVDQTKTDHISVWLWPYVDDYAASSIFRGIQRGMHGSGLRVVVASAHDTTWEKVHEAEARFLQETAKDPACAGTIMWYLGGRHNVSYIEAAREAAMPLVFLDRKPPEAIEADFVGTENVSAALQAVRYLIELGHRRIACLSNLEEVSSVRERVIGYRRALEEAGLRYSTDYAPPLMVEPGESDGAGVDRVIASLMRLENPPTAIFAVNDTLALHAMDALSRLNFRVPDQVSVFGFDGLLRWVPGGGTLSTVHQNFSRIGEIAAELLFERIQKGDSMTYRHVLLDAPLAIAGSTAPPNKDHDPGPKAGPQVELNS